MLWILGPRSAPSSDRDSARVPLFLEAEASRLTPIATKVMYVRSWSIIKADTQTKNYEEHQRTSIMKFKRRNCGQQWNYFRKKGYDKDRKYGKLPCTGATALVPVCTRKRKSSRHAGGTAGRLIMISLAAARVSIPCNNLRMF